VSAKALQELDRILGEGGEADDVLRSALAALVADPTVAWAGISFVEEGRLVAGPDAGVPDESRRTRVPISFQGAPVGELAVDGDATTAFLERVAALLSAYVLIGWDTLGEPWEP
jgi:putative methionine-R-sulfoxide reductase with GAF domain